MAGVFVPQQQKRDTLGDVVKGLQLASTAFGIYKDYSGLENQKKQMDLMEQQKNAELEKINRENLAKTQESQGILDVPGVAKKFQEGWRPLAEGETNPAAVKFQVPGEGGQVETKLFVPPMSEGEKFAAVEGGKKTDKAREEHDKAMKWSLDLRDRYEKDQTTQMTHQRLTTFAGIESAALNQNPTAASDMSLMFQFMKMMDPGSTVREGEYAKAQDTTTVPQRIVNKYNQMVVNGEALDPTQRANFYTEAKNLLAAQLKEQQKIDNRYKDDTKKYGIHDSSMVVDPTFEAALSEIEKGRGKSMSKNKTPRSISFPGEDKANASDTFDPDLYLKRQM